MKVYLATAGEYSDYRVMRVFAREEDAEAYELGTDVEEFEVDEGPVEVRVWHALSWLPDDPDHEGDSSRIANPSVWSGEKRDFDGRARRVEHDWHQFGGRTRLRVEGWDLERVRKVYSEQRAQHIARQDMGVEP